MYVWCASLSSCTSYCVRPCAGPFILGCIHLCAGCLPVCMTITWLNFHFYEQSSYLCQGDWWREVCRINVIVPLACQGARPPPCYRFLCFSSSPSPTYSHAHTCWGASTSTFTLVTRLVTPTLFITGSHSSLAVSHPSVDGMCSDIWRAHQHFSSSHSADCQPVETQT